MKVERITDSGTSYTRVLILDEVGTGKSTKKVCLDGSLWIEERVFGS